MKRSTVCRGFKWLLIVCGCPAVAGSQGPSLTPLECPSRELSERIDCASARLLGAPYQLGPLGEGLGGQFDRRPLFRFDVFDCTTYIETVLAASYSSTGEKFGTTLVRIRYKNGDISFRNRNHFPDLDWMPNNENAGFIEDLTKKIGGSLVQVASATIDKSKWFSNLDSDRIAEVSGDEKVNGELLKALRSQGAGFRPEAVAINYIPYDAFIEAKKQTYQPRENLFRRIKSGTFFNVVKVRHRATASVGTELLIWHQGLFVRKGGELVVRHAAPIGKQKVTELPAFDFLLAQYLMQKSSGLKGGLNLFGAKAQQIE